MRNRAVRIPLAVLAGLLLVVFVSAGVLYLMASIVPAEYDPLHLSYERRRQAADRFYKVVQDFINSAEDIKPFEISLTQDELNEYLASVDQIIQKLPGPDDANAQKALEQQRISGPMVVLRPGRLTYMARTLEHDKIISFNVAFDLTADGRLGVQVSDARVGLLRAPRSFLQRGLDAVKRRSPRPRGESTPAEQARGLAPSASDVGELLRGLAAAADGEPVLPVFGHRKNKLVRLVRIEVTQGNMLLGFEPYGRKIIARPSSAK